jgi:hypothetical protein
MKLALTLTMMAMAALGSPKEQTVPLTVQVYNYAKAPAPVVARAEKDAGRILREAGIEVDWLDCPITSAEIDAMPACRETGLANLTLRIIPEASASLNRHMLGFALPAPEGAVHAVVFHSRVMALSELRVASEAQILGIAMAHELGHLLLGPEKHSPAGLMRAQWSRPDLQLATVEQLRFSAKQGEMMREEVARRVQVEQSSRAGLLAARD